MSTNGSKPRDPLDSVDQAIEKLEGTDWVDEDEITGQDLLEAVRVGAAAATGKHRAMTKDEADEVTPTDPPRKPISVAPKSGVQGLLATSGGVVVKVVSAVNNPYALGALALLVAAFIAWLRLRR